MKHYLIAALLLLVPPTSQKLEANICFDCVVDRGSGMLPTDDENVAYEVYYQREAEIYRQIEEIYAEAEGEMPDVVDMALRDEDPRCHPLVSSISQMIAMRSGFLNLYADAVGSYCAGAEIYMWWMYHFERYLYGIREMGMSLQWQQNWLRNGFIWRYWV